MLSDEKESHHCVGSTNTNNMDKKQEDPSESAEDKNSLSPAAMTAIMVSIGIGFFTVCAVFFWLCKAQLSKAKKVKDECLLGKDDETEEHDPPELDDDLANMNKCCTPQTITGKVEGQVIENPELGEAQSESIKTEAFLGTTDGEEPDLDANENDMVLPSKFQDTEINSKQTSQELSIQSVVKFGPTFMGNFSISSAATNIDVNTESDQPTHNVKPEPSPPWCSEDTSCDLNQAKVILQESRPEYKQSISISSTDSNSENVENLAEKNRQSIDISPSLQHLSKVNLPVEKPDGQMQSNDNHDTFMFPQDNFVDNETALEGERRPQSLEDIPVASSTRTLEISRSLDLQQQRSLEKGCQLLQQRPRRSSMKLTGSEGCIPKKNSTDDKKFVHFPEDIRNIRKVYKYENFDDGMLLQNNNSEENNEQ